MNGVDNKPLPAIPAKRYFTIGEVSELCGVKAYVLRYWEQEFAQLKPMKRRGNRRYYQHHEVLLIRRIRDLLYEQGFTISGARNQLTDSAAGHAHSLSHTAGDEPFDADDIDEDATETVPAPLNLLQRDPSARTRAGDGARDEVLVPAGAEDLDEQELARLARDDLATIARATRDAGELPARALATSIPAGTAGIRAAALHTGRTAQSVPAPAPQDAVYTPEQVRAELLAIRSLLVS
jgi:DNA-binding transcriptional MerR regulator